MFRNTSTSRMRVGAMPRMTPTITGRERGWCGGANLEDACRRGYSGALSIEPHMVAVFHDASGVAVPPSDAALKANFVEYGRRLERLVGGIQARVKPSDR